jgi:hypothetical protein
VLSASGTHGIGREVFLVVSDNQFRLSGHGGSVIQIGKVGLGVPRKYIQYGQSAYFKRFFFAYAALFVRLRINDTAEVINKERAYPFALGSVFLDGIGEILTAIHNRLIAVPSIARTPEPRDKAGL